MARKAKVAKVTKPKTKTHTKAELVQHMTKLRDELQAASNLIGMLQNECREVVKLNKSLTQTVENLSSRKTY